LRGRANFQYYADYGDEPDGSHLGNGTNRAAEVFGWARIQLASIETGKMGDIVAVSEIPSKDIRSCSNVKVFVMKARCHPLRKRSAGRTSFAWKLVSNGHGQTSICSIPSGGQKKFFHGRAKKPSRRSSGNVVRGPRPPPQPRQNMKKNGPASPCRTARYLLGRTGPHGLESESFGRLSATKKTRAMFGIDCRPQR